MLGSSQPPRRSPSLCDVAPSLIRHLRSMESATLLCSLQAPMSSIAQSPSNSHPTPPVPLTRPFSYSASRAHSTRDKRTLTRLMCETINMKKAHLPLLLPAPRPTPTPLRPRFRCQPTRPMLLALQLSSSFLQKGHSLASPTQVLPFSPPPLAVSVFHSSHLSPH